MSLSNHTHHYALPLIGGVRRRPDAAQLQNDRDVCSSTVRYSGGICWKNDDLPDQVARLLECGVFLKLMAGSGLGESEPLAN